MIYSRPEGLPTRVQFIHKIPLGNVAPGNIDLQFEDMGARFREFEQVFAKHLGPGMKLERAGRSGVIRLVVPAFDLNAGFPPQAENTRAGLHAAKQLARWLRGHQQLIDDRVAAWGFTRPPLTDSFISYEIHRSDEPSRYQFYL